MTFLAKDIHSDQFPRRLSVFASLPTLFIFGVCVFVPFKKKAKTKPPGPSFPFSYITAKLKLTLELLSSTPTSLLDFLAACGPQTLSGPGLAHRGQYPNLGLSRCCFRLPILSGNGRCWLSLGEMLALSRFVPQPLTSSQWLVKLSGKKIRPIVYSS